MSEALYKFKIHPAKEGGFWAEALDIPGCFTQGRTLEEIRPRIKEALESWLGEDVAPSMIHIDFPVTNLE